MILSKKVNLSYGFFFLMGFVFGKMIDVYELWICFLFDFLVWYIIYFIMSFFILVIGICLLNNSMFLIILIDIFLWDLLVILDKLYKYIKIMFDVCCLIIIFIILIFIFYKVVGVGVGIVICVFIIGKLVLFI